MRTRLTWGRPRSITAKRLRRRDESRWRWITGSSYRNSKHYDGWALSLSSPSLRQILAFCPDDVRVGAWVKPFASFKPNVNPGYCWEPVIFWGGRPLGRDVPTVRDYVSCNITLQRGTHGAKPEAFCVWLFQMLGMERDDEFVDLFPGSGAVTRAWEKWRNQLEVA